MDKTDTLEIYEDGQLKTVYDGWSEMLEDTDTAIKDWMRIGLGVWELVGSVHPRPGMSSIRVWTGTNDPDIARQFTELYEDLESERRQRKEETSGDKMPETVEDLKFLVEQLTEENEKIIRELKAIELSEANVARVIERERELATAYQCSYEGCMDGLRRIRTALGMTNNASPKSSEQICNETIEYVEQLRRDGHALALWNHDLYQELKGYQMTPNENLTPEPAEGEGVSKQHLCREARMTANTLIHRIEHVSYMLADPPYGVDRTREQETLRQLAGALHAVNETLAVHKHEG